MAGEEVKIEGEVAPIEGEQTELELGAEEEEQAEEYTAAEEAAMAKGWNPNKEEVPEGKEWVSADEFIRNESFFGEIRKLKRANKSIQKSFDVLKEHHKKVAEFERTKALDELKRQKRTALEDDDHDAIIEIDDKILDIKATPADNPVDMQENDNHVFDAWVEKNEWYESNADMRAIADDLGNGYFQRMGGTITPEQVYGHVTEQMERLYPTEFGSAPARKRSAPAVEGARGSRAAKAKGKTKFTARDLDDTQRSTMKRFVKSGALSEEEYIKQLVEIGELV